MQTFVPGYLASIKLTLDPDGTPIENDLTVVGNVIAMEFNRAVLNKAVFGQKYSNSIAGQITGTISCSGHVSVETLPLFLPMIESDTPLAFEIVVGETGGTVDAGIYTGFVAITSYSIDDDAEQEWEWNLDGATSGDVTFTPPTP